MLVDVLHGPVFREDDTCDAAIAAVPAHVVATRPGDVIVFDEHLWHASHGGRNRHQWSACFVTDPSTAEEELSVRQFLASQFGEHKDIDYDPRHYPVYGRGVRGDCPPRWYAQLERLGAVEAAALEQYGESAATLK